MLDDLKYIHQRDAQDALGVAEKQWQQLQHDFPVPSSQFPVPHDVANVVYAGMGGSALAALLSRSWPGWKVPFEICRNYNIPSFVGKNTLFIASSYSGNTEETLSAVSQAEEKGASIAIITGGGKLQQIAQEKSYPLLSMPQASQPRFAVFYNLKALATLMDATGFGIIPQPVTELEGAASFIKESTAKWVPTIPTEQNPAKKLATVLAGKSIVIYAGPLLAPAAYKWKINFNESAKNVAWWNEFPEFNHNEFIGWSSHPIEKTYGIVELRSNFEHARVQKRFELSNKLLSGKKPAPEVVQVEGDSPLKQLLWAVAYGDFVSVYLALINGVNPSPVELVEKLKIALNE